MGLDSLPPAWEDLASSRERLARIETKVDLLLVANTAQQEHIATLDSRQTALEHGRVANRADIDAASQQIREWRIERQEVGMTGAQFLAWKRGVDDFMVQVNKGAIVVAAAATTRKQDAAIIGGLFSGAMMIGGLIAKVIFG